MRLLALVGSGLLLGACDSGGGDRGGAADELAEGKRFVFDFTGGDAMGFEAVFRDVFEAPYREYERRKAEGLDLGPVAPLPAPIGELEADSTHWLMHDGVFPMPDGIAGTGLLVQGTNRSDDMDMWIARELGAEDGLEPDTTYTVAFERLALAGNAPLGAVGVGGAPDLAVDGNVTLTDPTELEIEDIHVRHPDGVFAAGQPVALGGNAVCLARNTLLKVPGMEKCPLGRIPFALREFTQPATMRITTDAEARFWVMVGGHSGFESFSAIYYAGVDVTVRRVD
jgi:hypothetical protein